MSNVVQSRAWLAALPESAGEATLEQVHALLRESDKRKRPLYIRTHGTKRIFVDHSYLTNKDTVLLWCSAETLEASMVMNTLEHGDWL